MRIGTSLHALTDFGEDVKPFRQALAEAAECGFETVMLLNFPGRPPVTEDGPGCALVDLGASDPEVVQTAVREAGLGPAFVYQACTNVADDAAADASGEALAGLMALAARLGASIAIPNAGLAPAPLMPVEEKEVLLQRMARMAMKALEGAPPEVSVAFDIHYGAALESAADCRRLFGLAPDVRAGIALNIGHMTTCRQEGWRLLEDHPERVHVVAWKDHLLRPPPEATHPVYSVELGTGDSPFPRYAQALRGRADSVEHLITFEHVPLAEKKDALRRSLTYLKGLMGR
jgi:sugar phosphate isomerase/epimerase